MNKMAKKQKTEEKKQKEALVVAAAVKLSTRGRTYEGFVTKKFPTRVVVEFERRVFIPKYERFAKKFTRLHARIPEGMELKIGDYVKVMETRPLSKIIHFLVIEKIREAELSELAKIKNAEIKLEETKKENKK